MRTVGLKYRHQLKTELSGRLILLSKFSNQSGGQETTYSPTDSSTVSVKIWGCSMVLRSVPTLHCMEERPKLAPPNSSLKALLIPLQRLQLTLCLQKTRDISEIFSGFRY